MNKDQRWSFALFEIARSSPHKRDIAIFCASELIWFMAGISFGFVYPSILQILPLVFLPWGVSLLFSEWIRRPRPFHEQAYKPLIHLFVETPSFPSSHSTIAFAMVAAFSHDVTVWPLLLIAAMLVAIGRVAVGVHHVSDVIAGGIIGFGLAYAMKVAAILFFV